MSALSFPLSRLGEGGLSIDTSVAVAELMPEGAPPLPVEQVRVRGLLELIDTELVFRGHMAAQYEHPCDRCLEPLPFALDAEVILAGSAETAEGLDDAEDAANATGIVVQGTEANLAPGLWEELVLAVPMKHVQGPDAEGRCPACGRDLQGPVAHSGEASAQSESKFAGLAELFPELRDGKEE